MKRIETAIVGGGAAGMVAAIALGSGKNTAIFERGDRLGKKLSATGNGQGNVSNLRLSAADYFSDGKRGGERVENTLARFGREHMLAFLENLGGLFLPDERGRVYPAGRQASAVTDLLRYALAERDVDVRLRRDVTAIVKDGELFRVETDGEGGKETVFARTVLLCAGGKAAKNFGTDGSGYALARSLGHTVTPLYPSLVQLKTDVAPIKTLKGIRVDARVTAFVREGATDREIASERGDVIFTDYGVSGDAIFRISAFVTDKIGKTPVFLSLAFLPDSEEKALADFLSRKAAKTSLPENELLCGVLNNQLGRAVLKTIAGTRDGKSVAAAIKRFRLSVTGTLGFDGAQVTKGGVPLAETDENFGSRIVDGLFFAGEILDADGQCGGYNLQWAYSSARAAAEGIAAYLGGRFPKTGKESAFAGVNERTRR